ncbi:MAG TPA: hypothetical protein VEW25_11260 [Allosphingosinicella sp.]|nr:hypothetical protein [Allosphingosinicella sp.]
MIRQPPPLRFLAAVVGLWVGTRVLVFAPGWWVERSAAAPASEAAARPPAAGAAAVAVPAVPGQARFRRRPAVAKAPSRPPAYRSIAPRRLPAAPIGLLPSAPASPSDAPLQLASIPAPISQAGRPGIAVPGRLSGSAWLLMRGERANALAPGGTLGGSQAGLRILYRLNGDAARPLALSARLSTPAAGLRGAETALGIDWRPLARLPLHLLAERRQALGRDGRSAFALAVHGGLAEHPLPAGLRFDAYGQAGMVGASSRDLFADGAARLTLPVGRVSLGAGLWGGAQPGASRLDAGPHASLRLNLAGEQVRLAAEWRLRLAGDARPGSGPVLTLGSDF